MPFHTLQQLTDPWWGQQPDESLTAYTRFTQYRDQKRGERSRSEVAESCQRAVRTINEQAKAHRWDERVAAWDQEETRQHRERVAVRAERLAEAQMSSAEEILLLLRKSVRNSIDRGELLEPGEIPKWAESVIKLDQSAQKAPDHARAIYRTANAEGTRGSATVSEIDVPEFAGLEPAAQRERVTEMLSAMQRLGSYEKRELDSAGE